MDSASYLLGAAQGPTGQRLATRSTSISATTPEGRAMTQRWERIGGTVSLAGYTVVVTALAVCGLAGLV
ncbi:hypothetical protein [Methylobacterium sp. J-070]|uniref:hypothetical protein n=1 Tax=Methylobacterium sp. J-070 TaxID=2836650 RepID=UPI001FBBA8CD|nr:hypothetical protein [Methylobacterium sp. J-070]MCJ2052597.1 hypothetical protein [Methylobacterium sp. J-070]